METNIAVTMLTKFEILHIKSAFQYILYPDMAIFNNGASNSRMQVTMFVFRLNLYSAILSIHCI